MLKEVLLIWKLKQTEKKSLESREFWDIESFERIYKFERMERIRDESLPTKVGLEGRKCMLFRHLRNFCKKKIANTPISSHILIIKHPLGGCYCLGTYLAWAQPMLARACQTWSVAVCTYFFIRLTYLLRTSLHIFKFY